MRHAWSIPPRTTRIPARVTLGAEPAPKPPAHGTRKDGGPAGPREPAHQNETASACGQTAPQPAPVSLGLAWLSRVHRAHPCALDSHAPFHHVGAGWGAGRRPVVLLLFVPVGSGYVRPAGRGKRASLRAQRPHRHRAGDGAHHARRVKRHRAGMSAHPCALRGGPVPRRLLLAARKRM